MDKKKLRIGILLESYDLPSWVKDVIEYINISNHSEIVLVILKDNQLAEETSTDNSANKRNEFIYSMYYKWDKNRFKPSPDAFKIISLKDYFNCPRLTVTTESINAKDYFTDDDVATIKSHSIDVLVKFGFNDLGGDIFKSSNYGVWAYHSGDFMKKRGNSSAALEVFENWDETRMTLLQLDENYENSTIIYEAFFTTDHVSISRNQNILYHNSTSMLPRKLEDLFKGGEQKFFSKLKKTKTAPLFYYSKEFKTPTNLEAFKGIYRNWKQAIKGMISRKVNMPQWILLFHLGESEKLSTSFNEFTRMMPPKTSFWADPFVIEKNGLYYIFIEEFVFTENIGKISVIEMDYQGNYGEPTVVLKTPYHLSYPFLIEENGELYMLPETEENRTIELYKCVNFPTKWELQEVLIDNIMAVDSTIYKKNNKYWLFTSVKEYKDTNMVNELMLFHSDNLLQGNWIPHTQNPIAIDHRFSRPAGAIFDYEGRTFRPAQNCSKHYGYGMQIREIITLNEEEYEEKWIQSIYPEWEKDVKCVHTLNSSGKLTLIDAMIMRKR